VNGQAAAEPGRQKVIRPGVQLGQRDRDLAGQHRGPGAVEAQLLDLGVGLGGLEVAAQRLGGAGGGQRGVPALLGVADGEPRGVEGQDLSQQRQGLLRPVVQGVRCGGDPGQLLPQTRQLRVPCRHGGGRPSASFYAVRAPADSGVSCVGDQ
jgi:hypothetical protein